MSGLQGSKEFLATILAKPWRTRPVDPQPDFLNGLTIADISTAVTELLKQTRMEQIKLAKRLGVIPSRLSVMLTRGGPYKAFHLYRLAQVSKEYMLLRLEEFFMNKAQQANYNYGAFKRVRRSTFEDDSK